MRFLCLHGSGTNSRIFEAQTAALRYELGDHHRYEFVQGTLDRPMAPEIASLARSDDTYYSYFDDSSPASYVHAVNQLHEYVQAEGPFDGVLAFSQGAGLASMYLVNELLQHPERNPPFKVAVLIACVAVYNPAAWYERGEVETMDPAIHGQIITIPTAHIWGEHDERRAESEVLFQLSGKDSRFQSIHAGDHEVPGARIPGALNGAVKAIRRAVTTASTVK